MTREAEKRYPHEIYLERNGVELEELSPELAEAISEFDKGFGHLNPKGLEESEEGLRVLDISCSLKEQIEYELTDFELAEELTPAEAQAFVLENLLGKSLEIHTTWKELVERGFSGKKPEWRKPEVVAGKYRLLRPRMGSGKIIIQKKK